MDSTPNVITSKVMSPLLSTKVQVIEPYIKKLHKALQPSLKTYLEPFASSFLNWYWKDKKHIRMEHEKGFVPCSCKMELTLNATADVKEGFQS